VVVVVTIPVLETAVAVAVLEVIAAVTAVVVALVEATGMGAVLVGGH